MVPPTTKPIETREELVIIRCILPAILHEEDQTQDDHEILTTEYTPKNLNFVAAFLSIHIQLNLILCSAYNKFLCCNRQKSIIIMVSKCLIDSGAVDVVSILGVQ